MTYYYILDENNKPQASELSEWAAWLEEGVDRKRVDLYARGSFRVSTVFLGLDHGLGDIGPPVLWETMIFDREDGPLDQRQERYTSHVDAVEGHKKAVALVEKATWGATCGKRNWRNKPSG